MANELTVSPEELEAQAIRIKESATTIKNLIEVKMRDHLRDMAGEGSRIWGGVASEKFKKTFDQMCKDMVNKENGSVTQIAKLADKVIQVAQDYALNEKNVYEEDVQSLQTNIF